MSPRCARYCVGWLPKSYAIQGLSFKLRGNKQSKHCHRLNILHPSSAKGRRSIVCSASRASKSLRYSVRCAGMSQVVIANPIINSPFDEPTCHFRFNDEGITDEIARRHRRRSSYFVPIARLKEARGPNSFSFRHGMDAGPHRRKQARQRYPSPHRIVAQGRLRWRDADYVSHV